MTIDTKDDIETPIDLIPSDTVMGPLSDDEMRELLGKVRDLHAAMEYVKNEGPGMVKTVMESNPMLKMLGGMFPGSRG